MDNFFEIFAVCLSFMFYSCYTAVIMYMLLSPKITSGLSTIKTTEKTNILSLIGNMSFLLKTLIDGNFIFSIAFLVLVIINTKSSLSLIKLNEETINTHDLTQTEILGYVKKCIERKIN